jgi:hypothetical protein
MSAQFIQAGNSTLRSEIRVFINCVFGTRKFTDNIGRNYYCIDSIDDKTYCSNCRGISLLSAR